MRAPGNGHAAEGSEPWAEFTSAELETKLHELHKLIDSGMLTGEHYAKFKNDRGIPEIKIGVREFKCAGASAPQDHPHIYLDMGTDDTILCPYCATLFRYDEHLGPEEADPPDSVFLDAHET